MLPMLIYLGAYIQPCVGLFSPVLSGSANILSRKISLPVRVNVFIFLPLFYYFRTLQIDPKRRTKLERLMEKVEIESEIC